MTAILHRGIILWEALLCTWQALRNPLSDSIGEWLKWANLHGSSGNFSSRGMAPLAKGRQRADSPCHPPCAAGHLWVSCPKPAWFIHGINGTPGGDTWAERSLLLTPPRAAPLQRDFPVSLGHRTLPGCRSPAWHIPFTQKGRRRLLFLEAASRSTLLMWLVALASPFHLDRTPADWDGKGSPGSHF